VHHALNLMTVYSGLVPYSSAWCAHSFCKTRHVPTAVPVTAVQVGRSDCVELPPSVPRHVRGPWVGALPRNGPH